LDRRDRTAHDHHQMPFAVIDCGGNHGGRCWPQMCYLGVGLGFSGLFSFPSMIVESLNTSSEEV
jgi:hypothetical protein